MAPNSNMSDQEALETIAALSSIFNASPGTTENVRDTIDNNTLSTKQMSSITSDDISESFSSDHFPLPNNNSNTDTAASPESPGRERVLSSGSNGAGQSDYYNKGSAEVATESALTLAKIQHRLRLTKKSDRLVIVLVGLPGRGKSFIARKLQNFITWRGSECKVFNVGKYRRQAADGACDADFFDSKNEKAAEVRQKAASLALEDMLRWLDNENGVGNSSSSSKLSSTTAPSVKQTRKDRVSIFDATNSTKERREWVLQECTCRKRRAGKPTGVIFVESICDDEDLLHANFMTKVTNSPDYKDMNVKEGMKDLLSRVKKYEEAYETIEDDTQSYIKIYNLSSKMLVNHIYGRMAKSIVPALMAWNIGTRPVFICRAGQTMNELDRHNSNMVMSRSENLGRQGKMFRDALFSYMQEECLDFISRRQKATFSPSLTTGTSINGMTNKRSLSNPDLSFDNDADEEEEVTEEYVGADGVTPLPFPCHILSSTMPRARQTVEWEGKPYLVEMISNLNPLDKGDFTGHELEDLAVRHPEWYSQLVADPFYTRFPGGECYGDLTSRLESVVVDIEQQVGPVLVISHVSVLQVLVAYFRNTPVENCTSIAIPLNTMLKFTPAKGGGWQESQHRLLSSPHSSVQSDMNSMDNGMYCASAAGTPMTRTPVGSQVDIPHQGGNISPQEGGISPSPIWGDHIRRPSSPHPTPPSGLSRHQVPTPPSSWPKAPFQGAGLKSIPKTMPRIPSVNLDD